MKDAFKLVLRTDRQTDGQTMLTLETLCLDGGLSERFNYNSCKAMIRMLDNGRSEHFLMLDDNLMMLDDA